MTDLTLTLPGWVHVHTWHEGHGTYSTAIYQRSHTPGRTRVPALLEVSTYRDGRAPTVHSSTGPGTNDYLLAREIRAEPDRFRSVRRGTSACCTAGSEDFVEVETGWKFRIVRVAGHGEWGFELDDSEG